MKLIWWLTFFGSLPTLLLISTIVGIKSFERKFADGNSATSQLYRTVSALDCIWAERLQEEPSNFESRTNFQIKTFDLQTLKFKGLFYYIPCCLKSKVVRTKDWNGRIKLWNAFRFKSFTQLLKSGSFEKNQKQWGFWMEIFHWKTKRQTICIELQFL